MHIVLALASAVSWGASDFVGGLTGRRSPGTSVAFTSQVTGLAGLLVVASVVAGSAGGADLAWGAAAGVGGAAGVALLYHGLAAGTMSVVAPVTAVGAACLPVLFGLATGERPSAPALLGVVLALASVALLCGSPGPGDDRSDDPPGSIPAGPAHAGASPVASPSIAGRMDRVALFSGLAAGVGFGAFFICIARTGDDAGLWPLVFARLASVTILGTVVLSTRLPVLPTPGTVPAVVVTGLLDVVANACFLLASRRGLLSIVALLSSLYPAATVVLARIVLDERLGRAQAAGLAGAGAAVLLITLG